MATGIGGFAFGAYDRTAETAGAQSGGTPFLRRSSNAEDDTVHQQHQQERGTSLRRSLTGRRSSNASTMHSGRRQSISAQNQQTLAHANEVPEKHRFGTGIHGNTYYPDGVTPQNERAYDSEKQSDLAKEGLEAYESPESEEAIEGRKDRDVQQLARSLTQQSTWSQIPSNPFEAGGDSEVDPHSPNFKARAWTKSMIKLGREAGVPGRTSGIAFRNLNVHGFGAATDYQGDCRSFDIMRVNLG
jgi:ATP-binding cassette, subfamily G (WHITE), member 2, PDR